MHYCDVAPHELDLFGATQGELLVVRFCINRLWSQLVGQVLQLPVVRDVGLGKLHLKTAQALQSSALPQDTAATSGSSLLSFLTQAGKFFGKDPTKWEAVGQGKVH